MARPAGRQALTTCHEPLWVLDGGLALGDIGHDTTYEDFGLGKAGYAATTSEPVDVDDIAAGHSGSGALVVPWERITAVTVTEHRGRLHHATLTLAVGTDLIRWRVAIRKGAGWDHGWREVMDRLERHVPQAQVVRLPTLPRWRERLPGVVVFGGLALLGLLSSVGLYQEARVMDAPLERWDAGHYDRSHSVAFVFADSADALPLPYRIAFPSPMWVIDHDTIVTTIPGSRYRSPRCRTVLRTDLHLASRRTPLPCVDPHTGVELDPETQVTIGDVLADPDIRS
ncbi:hypothetical protein [Nitriliruptor alkaliphilus]|uniref:hypothetical protein n=1 Tax=Nitriliruptor alkaliphilus TaxID=427918 RepID=UPI0012EE6C2E|nr:hypothetical protein [Nitriliruptor alkaliphilus]